MNVLIDTNILLDFITKREPFFDDAKKIIEMCKDEKISGYIAAHSVMNIFFILRKDFTAQERRDILIRLMKIVSVVSIDEEKVNNALSRKDFLDFEDCLQDECAWSCNAEYIVTRNMSDYGTSKVHAIEPKGLLAMW